MVRRHLLEAAACLLLNNARALVPLHLSPLCPVTGGRPLRSIVLKSGRKPIEYEVNDDDEKESMVDQLIKDANMAGEYKGTMKEKYEGKINQMFAEGEESMRELAEQIKEEQSDRTSFFLDDCDARMYEEADGLMSKIDALTADFEKSVRPPPTSDVESAAVDPEVARLEARLAEARRQTGDSDATPAGPYGPGALTCVIVGQGAEEEEGPICASFRKSLEEQGYTIEVLPGLASKEGVAQVLSVASPTRDAVAASRMLFVCPDKPAGKKGGGFMGMGGGGGGGGGGDALADVDAGAMEMLLNAMPALERAVVLSAVGVDRRGQFPYSVANMGGALDKRLAADQALVLASLARGFDYTILRVGKIAAEGKASEGVTLAVGDSLDDGVSAASAAEALVQSMTQKTSLNATFSIANDAKAGVTNQAVWDDLFLKLDGPELLRMLLPVGTSASAATEWVAEWSQRWEKPGSGLTTPVVVKSTGEGGVGLFFSPKVNDYVSQSEEKKLKEAAEIGGKPGDRPKPMKVSRAGLEGGIEVLVEAEPLPRIRAKRIAYKEGAVVKEMSENEILRRLEDDLGRWFKNRN